VVSGHPLSTRAFYEGRCLVQDEASQLIAELAEPVSGSRVLDLCASPGGKTVRFSAGAGEGSLVVACDVRQHRVDLLRRTLARCHAGRVRVVRIPTTAALPFRDGVFDTVVIDAPCSGLGTIRRDPDIRWKRAAAELPRFAATERGLLDRSADLVAAGGRVIYSTCSSEPEENEQVIEGFLRDRPGFMLTRVHHSWPFRDELEAFFGAVLQRS
jgi:16S rRNA (cytosine967-C5)-methyltransferase